MCCIVAGSSSLIQTSIAAKPIHLELRDDFYATMVYSSSQR